VIKALDGYVCVEVFAEDDMPSFEKYGVESMPTMMFITTEGREIGRFGAFKPPADFVRALSECVSSSDNIEKGKKLLAGDPKNAEGLYLLALGYLYQKGRSDSVIENIEKLKKLDVNKDNKVFICRGLKILSKIKKEAFSEALLKIVEIDPENESGETIHALYMLGILKRTNSEQMKGFFEKLRKLDPDDKHGYDDDMAFAEALIPYYKKDYKKTIKNLKDFMDKYKNSELASKALLQIASCWYRAKEKDKCIEELDRLLKQYPDSGEAGSAKALLKRLKK